VFTDPSLDQLDIVMERDRITILLNTIPAYERNWQHVFDEVNIVYTDESIPALIGADTWIVHGEPLLLWPALDEEVLDGVLVGVNDAREFWYLLVGPGIEEPEDLLDATYCAGPAGWSWDNVFRVLMDQEFGLDADELRWVTIAEGGSDGMMQAVLAGQCDAFMGQPRHIEPMEEAGGQLLFDELYDNAQGMFIVQRETWENNYDAVCAALEGMLEANQWIDAGTEPNKIDRVDDIIPMLEEHGYDTDGAHAAWEATYPFTWSYDMGADVDAWDQMRTLLQTGDVISDDFDWRDHTDFTCVWELQEAYGLPLNPDPDSL
jgi:hypothetical protein